MERLSLPPGEALVPEPSRSVIEEGKGPIELLPFLPPTLLKVFRKDGRASQSLLILILSHRLGRHPGLVSEESLGSLPQAPPTRGAVRQVSECSLPVSRIQQAGARLDRALRELPDRKRAAGTEADLGFTQPGAQRLGDQIAKVHHIGFETRRIEVSQVVAHHIHCRGSSVEGG